MPLDMILAADIDLASLVALDGASIDCASSVLMPAEGPFWRVVGFIQARLIHVLVHTARMCRRGHVSPGLLVKGPS